MKYVIIILFFGLTSKAFSQEKTNYNKDVYPLIKSSNYTEALPLLEKFLQEKPDHINANYWCAKILEIEGKKSSNPDQIKKAKEHYSYCFNNASELEMTMVTAGRYPDVSGIETTERLNNFKVFLRTKYLECESLEQRLNTELKRKDEESDLLLEAEEVLIKDMQSNYRQGTFGFNYQYNQAKPLAFYWYKYREEKFKANLEDKRYYASYVDELGICHEKKEKIQNRIDILTSFDKDLVNLLNFDLDTLKKEYKTLSKYYKVHYPENYTEIIDKIRIEKASIQSTIDEFKRALTETEKEIQETELQISKQFAWYNGKPIQIYLKSGLYSYESVLKYYAVNSDFRKKYLIEEVNEIDGRRTFKTLNDNIEEIGYRQEMSLRINEKIYLCGSFTNKDRYSKDKDGFVACVQDDTIGYTILLMKDFNIEKDYKNQNDNISNMVVLENGDIVIAHISNGISNIKKINRSGSEIWGLTLDRLFGGVSELLSDEFGDIYVFMYDGGQKYAISYQNLIKISNSGGKIVWSKKEIIERFSGTIGGVLILNQEIYIAYNYKAFYSKLYPNVSMGYHGFNIGIAKINCKTGELIKNKVIPSEEPKYISRLSFESGNLICFGRRGNYDFSWSLDPSKVESILFEYGDYKRNEIEHFPLKISFDKSLNTILE